MELWLQSSRQYVTLEHGTPLFRVWVGSSHLVFTSLRGFGLSYLTSHLLIALSPWPLLIWCQILPNPPSCRQYVQEKLTSALVQPSLTSHTNHFFSASRRWCGKHHGPPSIKVLSRRLQLIIRERDLETPFRCLGACMPQWQVLRVRRKVCIIDLRSNDSVSVRHQLIDSHVTDCTYSTLRTIVIIGGTSRIC